LVLPVAIPRLCRRVHVPEAVGLLLGGVIVGPHVLGFFGADHPIADFAAELGKLLLMFFAGLDIDLGLFRRARTARSPSALPPRRFLCCSAASSALVWVT
jgi:Kef-type K+ transport system membrane component KefB